MCNICNKGFLSLYKNFYKLIRKRWSPPTENKQRNEEAAHRRIGTNDQYAFMLNLTSYQGNTD